MRIKAPLLALIALFLATAALPAHGWDKNGHRIVAEIAERHLDPGVRKEIRKLVGDESLAQVSTWADEIRSDSRWDCAKPFHFITLPPGVAYLDQGLPPGDEGDALRAVFHYAKVLGDRDAKAAARAEALRLLVHFVGDLHQPLHLNLGCDLGGNRVKVNWFGQPTNLHAVWDKSLIDQRQLSFTEFSDFIDSKDDDLAARLQQESPLEWIVDTRKQQEGLVYRCYTGRAGDNCPCFCGGCEDGSSIFGGCREVSCSREPDGDVQLAYTYADHTRDFLDRQLLKGGLRLAGLLDWILGKRPAPPPRYREAAAALDKLEGWSAPFESCPSPKP